MKAVWPANDPPMSTWFETGKLTPHMKESVLFVTKHLSGWCTFAPAHIGLERLHSGLYPVKVRKVAIQEGQKNLFNFFNLARGIKGMEPSSLAALKASSHLPPRCFQKLESYFKVILCC